MAVAVVLGLSWLCVPLGALVLEFNNIKGSAELQGTQKVKFGKGAGVGVLHLQDK